MKFPSTFAGGTSPSGSSFASTYPAVCGSRVGGGGRFGRATGTSVAFVAWPNAEFSPSEIVKATPRAHEVVLMIFIFTRVINKEGWRDSKVTANDQITHSVATSQIDDCEHAL